MDYFQSIVADWLVSDSQTLVAQEYYLRLTETESVTSNSQKYRWPDILAVRPVRREAFLCEVTWSKGHADLKRRIDQYANEEEPIRRALAHWLAVAPDWRLSVWMFMPQADIAALAKRRAANWRVRFTALEHLMPWSYTHGCRPFDDHLDLEIGSELSELRSKTENG